MRKIIMNSCLRGKNLKQKSLPVRRSRWLITMAILEIGCQTVTSSKGKLYLLQRNRVLFEKLTDSQLVKKFPHFMEPEDSL